MHSDLALRRRVLLVTYQRYLDADRAWSAALSEVKTWFPSSSQPGPSAIGNPGSMVRRLYEQREHALAQLEAARQRLETAKQRLAAKRQKTHVSRVVLLTYASH